MLNPPSESERDDRAWAGRCLLVAGVLGLLLMLAARSGGLPPRWTVTILQHAPLWGLGSVMLSLLGGRLLWLQQHPPVNWAPASPGQRFASIVVYSRRDCCLCEDAVELISRYRQWLPAPIEVDIDEDSELQDRFHECVPVIECDGRIRFRGRVSEPLLRRLIEGTPPMKSRS